MKQTYKLINPAVRERAIEAIRRAPEGYVVTLSEETRSLDANAKLWGTLSDISRQVEWYGRKLSPEAWKHVFSAALKQQDVVPNLDGTGFVVLGQSTSKMSKREFSELIELCMSFGAERGVRWTDTREEAA